MTELWREPTDGDWLALARAKDLLSPHNASLSRHATGIPPMEVRIGLRLACSPLPQTTPVTSDVSMALLRTLSQPPISDLIADLTHVDGLTWRRYGGRGRTSFAAILTDDDMEAAPTAWACFNPPPPPAVQLFGQDPRCADFVLAVEPRTRHGDNRPPAELHFWYRWFIRSLSVPAAVHGLLTEELNLTTAADPPVRTGVFLSTPEALTQLIDVEQFRRVPGSYVSRYFSGGAVAGPEGQDPTATAKAWIMQLCDRDLPLDGYEQTLLTLGS